MAWDQPDNAARVPRRRTGGHLARALGRLMTPGARDRSRAVAGRAGRDDGLEVAAGWVEGLAAKG
jgi:UDP:flavonoid glycosyltransferase YjiC (YdhE family)